MASDDGGNGTGTIRSRNSAPGSATSKGSKKEVLEPANTSDDNPAVDLRNMRRIIAEDPEWSLATVPLLTDLCVKHIINNFEYNSKILDSLLLKDKAKVLQKLSVTLPLRVTANLIHDDGYWKRCCKSRWQICDIVQYDGSWKRMYFERNLQEIIEHYVPGSDMSQMKATLLLSASYVRRLIIQQLLPPVREAPKPFEIDDDDAASDSGEELETDHLDFNEVVPHLTKLEDLRISYGVKDCGMNFEWSLFQFTAKDCLLLSKCIANAKYLRVLALQRSKIDDDKIRVMISHILDHPSLEELDLSHNLIGDRGARAIGKFLNNHSRLVRLNLCDNSLRAAGAQAIAHALTKNSTLQNLNVRLNRIGDEGGQALCAALLKNRTLREINLACNDLTEPTANVLSQVISSNPTLIRIDLSCNRIGIDGGKQIQEGMEENRTTTYIDLRLTECGQEAEYCINQVLSANRERERHTTVAIKNALK